MSTPHPSDSPTLDDLDDLFTYYQPTQAQVAHYAAINQAAKELARVILSVVEPCADRDAAILKVREARMLANAAIACSRPRPLLPQDFADLR